ncbi:MAG: tetratricopeptide repeat protein [Deltaproteobacteria bacterium]|nr:tetratricopeptide repeat protein [Deltaproteobacteria bacterium]
MIDVPTEDLRLMLECGYLHIAMKRFKEAREVFEGISLLAPDSDVPLVALGNVSFVESKFEEAIKVYKKALEVAPQSAFAKAYLGEALFFNEKREEAVKVLEEASKLDPVGKSGEFARSLLELIRKGFNPQADEKNQKK